MLIQSLLQERAGQLDELEALRPTLPNKSQDTNTVLLRLVDSDGQEISRAISQTQAQREAANTEAQKIVGDFRI